jgi:hypothetical protein
MGSIQLIGSCGSAVHIGYRGWLGFRTIDVFRGSSHHIDVFVISIELLKVCTRSERAGIFWRYISLLWCSMKVSGALRAG